MASHVAETNPFELLVEHPDNLQQVMDAMFDGVYFVDANRRIHDWSAGAAALTGFAREEVICHRCADNILVHVDESGKQLCRDGCPLLETLTDGKPRQAKVYLRHKQGYRIPVAIRTVAVRSRNNRIVGAIEAFREITDADQWKARIAELERAVYIDGLTEIPNRRFLEGQIERMLHECRNTHEPFALLMIDVDHFKSVNDTYGHDAGDGVLRNISQTLLNTLRGRDILGRWGGDEFVMLLAGITEQQCAAIAERICGLVSQTVTYAAGKYLKRRISIGAAVSSTEDDLASLVKRADQQLYRCKHNGRARPAVA